MKHAREDYNRIQDPAGKIGEDEPVFLIRAKDVTAAAVVRTWADLMEGHGGGRKMADIAREWANVIEKWQHDNGCKIPDL